MWTILIFVGIAAVSAEPQTFYGEKVFRVTPQNAEHIQLLKSIAKNAKLDFWLPDSVELVVQGKYADFRAESHVVNDVQALIEHSGMPYEILINDLQDAIVKQRTSNSRAHGYEKYNDLETIDAWSADIAAQNPGLVTRSQLGTSYAGRPIYLLKLSTGGANKRAIFIDCGFHAREWVSPAFCQWFVRVAVNGYGTDAEFTNLLNNLDFYVLPVLNVDGYVYTWTSNRMWRKTRSPNSGSSCVGTDPNRNFDAGWCTVGASSNPCDETYCGTRPESERETQALADFIRSNISNIKAYLTIHSYSQMLLFPYSYTFDPAVDHDELNELASGAVAALTSLYNTQYTYGPGGATIYLAAGGSDDWAYDEGVKYSYTFELRDEGRYGFILPENQIIPTSEETVLAVNYIANHVLNNT